MRSTRARSSARLVITADTWGRSDIPANVAPPLKSTSTRLSCSGEWVSARPRTSVRSSSDLPEPVAPIDEPVRPRALEGRLLEVEEDRTVRLRRSRAAPAAARPAGRGCQACAGSRRRTSSSPSRCWRPACSARSPPTPGPARAARRRAVASAVARSHWSAAQRCGGSPSGSALAGTRLTSLPDVGRSRTSRSPTSSSRGWRGKASTVREVAPADRTDVALDDEQQVAVGRAAAAPSSTESRRDQPARTDGVDDAARPGVRQPLDPVPRRPRLGRGQDRDGQVLRGMTDGGGADHRPRHRPGPGGSARAPRSARRTAGRPRAGRSGCCSCTDSSRRTAPARWGSAGRSGSAGGATSRSDGGWSHTPYRTRSPSPPVHTSEPSSATAGSAAGAG